jgi:hypothetical protein
MILELKAIMKIRQVISMAKVDCAFKTHLNAFLTYCRSILNKNTNNKKVM